MLASSEVNAEKIDDLRGRIDSLALESPHIPQAVHTHERKEGESVGRICLASWAWRG
jgi:hypothetical protein